MHLLEFQERFATEMACDEYLFAQRWPDGFVCPHCGGRDYSEVISKARRHAEDRMPLLQCKACTRQTSVTAGTLFHKTKTDLRKWFLAVYLVANDKRGVAATTIARNIGVSYPTAWSMLNKIRQAMADRNARYQLGGLVQIDDAFFGGESHGEGQRGRGSDQDPVIVAVEVERHKPKHIMLAMVPDLTRQTVSAVLSERLQSSCVWETDGSTTYAACAKELEPASHIVTKSGTPEAHETFEWIDKIISLAKAFINGTYHGRMEYRQSYLEEFVYRFNRRHFGHRLAERLLFACANTKPVNI
jgi:transposase-like protein